MLALAADPAHLQQCLAAAVAQCFDEDQAEAVIIGGGPLAQAATALAQSFDRPIMAPTPAAVARLLTMMRSRTIRSAVQCERGRLWVNS